MATSANSNSLLKRDKGEEKEEELALSHQDGLRKKEDPTSKADNVRQCVEIPPSSSWKTIPTMTMSEGIIVDLNDPEKYLLRPANVSKESKSALKTFRRLDIINPGKEKASVTVGSMVKFDLKLGSHSEVGSVVLIWNHGGRQQQEEEEEEKAKAGVDHSTKASDGEGFITGVVTRLVRERKFGFLSYQSKGSKNDTFFHFNQVQDRKWNLLEEGMEVKFQLETNPSNPEKVRASLVVIERVSIFGELSVGKEVFKRPDPKGARSSDLVSVPSSVTKTRRPPHWRAGSVTEVVSAETVYLKEKPPESGRAGGSDNNDEPIRMCLSQFPGFVFDLKEGDQLEFILEERVGTRSKYVNTLPTIKKARLSYMTQRTDDERKTLFRKMTSFESGDIGLEVGGNVALWEYITSNPPTEEKEGLVRYMAEVINALGLILNRMENRTNLVEPELMTNLEVSVKEVLECKALQDSMNHINRTPRYLDYYYERQESVEDDGDSDDDQWQESIPVREAKARRKEQEESYKSLTREFRRHFRSFCRAVLAHLPNLSLVMFRKIKLFCQSEEESKSPDFLIDCLNVACKHLDKKAGGVDTEDWQSLPILPSRFEIMGELLSKHKSLSKVSVDRGYKDGDDYMSTYFRLLRAEAFTGIQTGIQDFLRDPTAFEEDKVFVYENVGLVGLEVSHKSVCLALKFTTPKPVDNWAMSRRLMQGNLVCISVDTGFFSYFWATVSNRDVDVLRDKSTIFVEVCRNEQWQNFNLPNLEVGECTAVMLESPTYFLPMQAVLSRFSEKSIRKFKLYSEIVKAKPSHSQLTYLTNQSETIRKWLGASEKQDEKDTSVGRRSKERDVLFGWMYRGKRIANVDDLIEKHMKCFDPSQKEAYKYALTHKLAIVQGPPGCGKTFIGHKILEVILACRPDTPVLILTYKNHALDEFLKGALGFCHDRLVRVGNRSDEPELDEYNLNKRKMGKHFFDENGIGSRRNDINAMGLSAWQSMQAVYDASHLKDHSWLLSLTETQIEQLIIRGNPELDMRANLRDMKKHGSLRNFAEWCLRLNWQYKNGDKPAKCFLVCLDALHTAVIKWFPFKSEGQAAEGRLWPRRMAKQNSQPGTEDFDEEDFEEMQKARDIGGDGLHRDPRYMLSDHGSPIFTLNQIPGESTANDASLLDRNDLWDLSTQEREEFIATILSGRHQQARTQFHDIYNSLGRSVRIKSHLGREGKLSGLGDELVIGMTITGASINYDVIEQVRPSVVIVEEAAEVLEPSLLAALSRSTQHLIMIGDHKQLRPGVETHELVRNHSLDVSMMERLIKSGYPFRSLKTQSRMRPEFSALLKDIYPDLRDNLEVVCKRKPLACMAKSLFFWTHSHEEDRCFRGDTNNASKTNTAEADMVTALAIFIVQSGCPTEELTILASYQGQARLIRKKIRALEKTLGLGKVDVKTIDMFQGDENNVIILSLVRSNPDGSIGFLGSLNRRCVAQSRAKLGFYIVGNSSTLTEKSSAWKPVLTSLQNSKAVGPGLEVQCPNHASLSVREVGNAEELEEIIASPRTICKIACGEPYPCQIPSHECKKTCTPVHDHKRCPFIYHEKFESTCGHDVERMCHQSLKNMKCQKEVPVTYSGCTHVGQRICSDPVQPCQVMVLYAYPRCGHKTEKECSQKEPDSWCRVPCEKKMNCSHGHPCRAKCGAAHDHDVCDRLVEFAFELCKHPSEEKKKCSAPIETLCRKAVTFVGSCGHEIEKKCFQDRSEVTCQRPCSKSRGCGHSCQRKCGEDCEKGDCPVCQKASLELFKVQSKRRLEEIEKELENPQIPDFSVVEVEDQNEKFAVQDLVLKFVQPEHMWMPVITKIERIKNLTLEARFEKFKQHVHGEYVYQKFHGTSEEGIQAISREGFRIPGAKKEGQTPLMFGRGIYFATDSSKSANPQYTKGSNKLLLCDVLLGKSKTMEKEDHSLRSKDLKDEGFDSVFAPRNSAVKYDEFVVYDPDQALPKYVIHYSPSVDPATFPSLRGKSGGGFQLSTLKPSRNMEFDNPEVVHFKCAESTFYRMSEFRKLNIKSIRLINNPELEDRFNAKKSHFAVKGIPSSEILAFHGTAVENLESIARTNLDSTKKVVHGKVYGQGNYFSEHPDFSLTYGKGKGLILFRVLPGNEYSSNGSEDYPDGYQCKKVKETEGGYGQQIIIRDSHQFLPLYIYDFE